MTDATSVVEQYIAAWNETDPAGRRAAVARLWTRDGSYVDPMGTAAGHEAIDGYIAAAQGMFPGHTFRLAGPIDAHHHLVRFTWELVAAPDAEPLVVGFDVVELTEDGRLRAVHGFLDKVPAA